MKKSSGHGAFFLVYSAIIARRGSGFAGKCRWHNYCLKQRSGDKKRMSDNLS